MVDTKHLTPSQRLELTSALTSSGGRLLDSLLERRIGEIEREAGAVLIDGDGETDRLVASVQPLVEEAKHLRYLRDLIGHLIGAGVPG